MRRLPGISSKQEARQILKDAIPSMADVPSPPLSPTYPKDGFVKAESGQEGQEEQEEGQRQGGRGSGEDGGVSAGAERREVREQVRPLWSSLRSSRVHS